MPLITPFQDWHVRTKLIVVTLPFIALVTLVAAWALYTRDTADLEEKLIQRAHSLSTQIMADRKYYTSVILPRAIDLGGSVGEDYQHIPGRFPLPATFVREVSEITAVVGDGYTANLISPWPINREKGAKDEFQKEAFVYLLENPSGIFHRTDRIAGMAVMRFITADRASVQSCADCHNAHPRSPKRDFKLNDVMGGLEIIIPIDHYVKERRQGLAMTLAWGGGIGLFITGIVLWGARQAILQPLARLTARLRQSLRAEEGPFYLAGPADSGNEMTRFERACLDMQALLVKQRQQLRLGMPPSEQRVVDHAVALLDAQDSLALTIDPGRHAVFYLDQTGVIRWVNRKAVDLTARLATELIGRSFLTVLSPESAARAKARLAAVQRGEAVPPVVEFEVIQTTGGSKRIEATVASVGEDQKVVGRLLVARELSRPASSAPG